MDSSSHKRFSLESLLPKLLITRPVKMLSSISSSLIFPSHSPSLTIVFARLASISGITTILNRVRKRRVSSIKWWGNHLLFRALPSPNWTAKIMIVAFHRKTLHQHTTSKSLIEQMKSLDWGRIRRLACLTWSTSAIATTKAANKWSKIRIKTHRVSSILQQAKSPRS